MTAAEQAAARAQVPAGVWALAREWRPDDLLVPVPGGRRDGTPAEVAAFGMLAAGGPSLHTPQDVRIMAFLCHPPDDDNLLISLKRVRDQFIVRGLLPDDRPEWWLYAGVRCAPGWRGQPWVVFMFAPRGAADE